MIQHIDIEKFPSLNDGSCDSNIIRARGWVAAGVIMCHDHRRGIGTVAFFVLYQQFENNVLQVTVMSRTVNVNPLGIFVSVLVGVELFGLLGALLAIPAAGVIQVVVRDLWDEHLGRPKSVPTIGASETPMDEVTSGA